MKDLLTYTKLCQNCINNKCTGGYNCKFGACLEKFVICYDDLNYGYCNTDNCNKIHLSKRNLKPILKKIYYTIDKHVKSDIVNLNNEIINNNINNDYILNSINQFIDITTVNTNEEFNELDKIVELTINNHYNSDSDDDECMKSIFSDKIDKLIIIDDY
jgi:hypothetical protein